MPHFFVQSSSYITMHQEAVRTGVCVCVWLWQGYGHHNNTVRGWICGMSPTSPQAAYSLSVLDLWWQWNQSLFRPTNAATGIRRWAGVEKGKNLLFLIRLGHAGGWDSAKKGTLCTLYAVNRKITANMTPNFKHETLLKHNNSKRHKLCRDRCNCWTSNTFTSWFLRQ